MLLMTEKQYARYETLKYRKTGTGYSAKKTGNAHVIYELEFANSSVNNPTETHELRARTTRGR